MSGAHANFDHKFGRHGSKIKIKCSECFQDKKNSELTVVDRAYVCTECIGDVK